VNGTTSQRCGIHFITGSFSVILSWRNIFCNTSEMSWL